MENERDSAAKRVRKYLDERARIPNIDGNLVHGLHTGDEEREAELTVSDLRVLVGEREVCGALLFPGVMTVEAQRLRCVNRKPCAIPGHSS